MDLFLALIIVLIVIIFVSMPMFHKYIYGETGKESFLDTDDTDYSDYGNISASWDMDSLLQRTPRIPFNNSDEIDNSDIVDQVISGGDTVFQPAHGVGVSATTNASMNSFTLAGPSGLPYFDDISIYDSPTNGQINIDEKLAISQQHRGSIARKAVEGHVRSTRNLYQKYFTNELNENSNRIWWDDSSEENMETDFGTDIDPM
jgi:hypothetical protein